MSNRDISFGQHLSRRALGKIALGGALKATALGGALSSSAQEQTNSTQEQISSMVVRSQSPGIKLRCSAPANPTDEDLLFYKQLGVDSVFCPAMGPENQSVEGLRTIKKRYADAGLIVDNIIPGPIAGDLADIVLNRPGRDSRIEFFKTWIRTLSSAGFNYTLATFNATMAMVSGHAEIRGSQARDCDLNSSEITGDNPNLRGIKGSANSLFFGREYSRDEIWANYSYFIKQVVPVAEKAGVAIGFHPDDPPTPSVFGVPRIFSTFDDCKKALRIANSPKVGMCLCSGTWAEGGAAMGIDAAGAIRYFGSQKQLFEIHFRSVSSPLPHFHETYVDNGYYDMYKIMKALVDAKYDGVVQLDHFVPMVGDGGPSNIPPGSRTYEAFAVGYMRALQQRAQREARA